MSCDYPVRYGIVPNNPRGQANKYVKKNAGDPIGARLQKRLAKERKNVLPSEPNAMDGVNM